MQTIQQLWNTYEKNCVPADASTVQIQETRRAFFAGAAAMWQLFGQIADQGSEEKSHQMFERLDKELVEFMENLGKGN